MAKKALKEREKKFGELCQRDHTLHGGMLFGLDGYIIELQARAMKVLEEPDSFSAVTRITGMARGSITESLDRISGAFAKIGVPKSEVEILIK